MNEPVIYDAFNNGSENERLGAVLVWIMLTAVFIYTARCLRSSRLQGKVFSSRWAATTRFWNVVGKYPTAAILLACLVCLGLSALPVLRYVQDKATLDRRDYEHWAGAVTGYTAVKIFRQDARNFDTAMGLPASWHERDELTVSGRIFFIECDLAAGIQPDIAGHSGKCLKLQTGRNVLVDYILLSPTTYRREPLRIRLLDP